MRLLASSVFAAFLAIAPQGALAEDNPAAPTDEDWGNLQTCIEMAREAGGSSADCIGAVSEPCLELPGNSSTVMMGACLDKEATMWDELLNIYYGDLKDAVDAEQFGYLRDSQRAWIEMRDRTCEFEASLWGGGTGAGPAAIGCFMRETGQRASFLGEALNMAAGN